MGDVYDNVFRTLMNDCRQLMLPVLNEVFGERYQGDETVLFSPNEHMMAWEDAAGKKRVTDTNFRVLAKAAADGAAAKMYHWECQGRKDSRILIRFFEYDAQIALDEGVLEDTSLTVAFPHSAVLYLRSGRKIPESYRNLLHTSGGSVQYDVRVLKVGDYTAESIFKKNLLILLPFYIFRYEKKFHIYNKEEEKLEELLAEYRTILKRLDTLEEKNLLSTYDKQVLRQLMRDVAKELTKKYKKLQEGLVKLMVGEMIETEARKVLDKGINIGISQGISQGISRGVILKLKELVGRKLQKGKSAEVIAEELEEDLSVVQDVIRELQAERAAG